MKPFFEPEDFELCRGELTEERMTQRAAHLANMKLGNAGLDYDSLRLRVERLEKERDAYREALDRIAIRMNKVTSYHRHGNPIPPAFLDNLCNEQIVAEAALAKYEVKP